MAALAIALAGCGPGVRIEPEPGGAPAPVRFEIIERFGVTHPEQIIDFDVPAGTPTNGVTVVNDAGEPVVFQFLDGGKKLAVRTDLPANATKSWTLQRGQPVTAAGVTVTETETYYEIANERTAVRVTKPGPVTNWKRILAPVQGARLADGTWTATAPNYLTVNTTNALAMAVRFVERGPLVTTVEVSYRFVRPDNWHPVVPNLGRAGGDDGYYRSTITLQAGQPSILFEEDTDMQLSYRLNCYGGVQPNQARYRGHSCPDPKYGYTPDGKPYAGMQNGHDAFVDLAYDRPRGPGMFAGPDTWPLMVVWSMWWSCSGPYWQIYDKDAPDSANLIGIFTGQASRGTGTSVFGTGLFTEPAKDGGQPQAGFGVVANHWNPNNHFLPHIRYPWRLFVSTKRDLLPYDQVQPIARQMNIHGGINLNKVHRWTADFPDSVGGYDALYVKPEVMQRLRQRIQTDDAFYQRLYNEFPMSRHLYELLRDQTGAKAHQYTATVSDLARKILDALVNKDGIYDFTYHYWHGGLHMQREGEAIALALGDPHLSAEDRVRLKAVAALFANILWDNDYVPVDNHHGFNMGTANMPQMFTGFRHFYARLLASHPMMKERVAGLAAGANGWVRQVLNEHGASFSGSGYQHAAVAPPLNIWQRLQRLGLADVFRDEPRLTRYADFYMNLFAPPDPRFGTKYRQLICLGDTSISGGPGGSFAAQLATCLAPWQPQASARLMRLWRETGAGYDTFFGTGVLKVDHDLPAADEIGLRHEYFPGYYAVLRSGAGTPDETAVWMVNGDFYRDHRHPEMGNIVIYALGAPLAVDMGTNYDPLLNGATHHNVVIPAKHLGRPWDKEQAQLNDCSWEAREPQPANLLAFRHSGFVGSTFANPGWRREARLLYADPAAPVILVQDRFMVQPAEPWVFHWNVMAEGAVRTPAGEYTPATREPASQDNPVIPTVGPVKPLAAGVNMFQFAGYRWGTAQQPQPSVDFDVALVAGEPQEFYIGNWAHKGLASGSEVFQRVNGRPFEERQHRLCVRGQTGFTTVILPRRKDAPAPYDTVTAQDGIIRVAGGDAEILIAPYWHAYRQGERTVLTTLTAERVEHAGIVASGGPVEITVDAAGATITAHGAPGPRALTLPGQWRAAAPLKRAGESWSLPYDGGAAVTVTLLRP